MRLRSIRTVQGIGGNGLSYLFPSGSGGFLENDRNNRT